MLGNSADVTTVLSELDALSGSDNETASEAPVTAEDLFGPLYAKTLRIALLSVMLALSLLGNSIVCHRLLTSRRHRMFKAQVLFLNLAFADLLVTLVTMSSQLVWEVVGRVWVAGDAACRLFKVLQTFALVSSTYMLVGIAVDRHCAICKPLAPAPRPRSLVAACWLLSLVPSLPNMFMFRLVVIRDECYCASVFYIYQDSVVSRQAYMAFVFTLVFILPLVALVTLYSCILYRMWKMSSTATSRQPGDAVSSSCERAESARTTLPKARLRTLKMAIIIFVAFIVTNLPYMVQEMLLAFAENVSLGPHVVAVFGVVSASNSAVNPYVFLAFNGGAAAFGCDAHVRVLWRRLACSSGSRRTTATFRTAWSTLQTRNRRRSPTVKMFPSPDNFECGEAQKKHPETPRLASLGDCL
ncbi:vasopressin V1a receptor-like [Dermacentor andersoni]|uniref:vasopressin V1a receptor-like n=1 Tax=Dermacentor andersoni TaxID=34620 RepID=UPI002155D82B|nr:vasopressin V1a receptor-like [Dermacentor andersoni]